MAAHFPFFYHGERNPIKPGGIFIMQLLEVKNLKMLSTIGDNIGANAFDNPDMKGSYNYHKYLAAFNTRVKTLLIAFNPEIRDKIIVKINKKDDDKLVKQLFTMEELRLDCYDLDDYKETTDN
jgi:hypothetical protein